MGVTSTLTASMVNDFRFAYAYWHNRNLFPTTSSCQACLGLGFPEMSVIGTNVQFGNTSNATQGRDLRRYEFNDNFTWQKGKHRIRFGGGLEFAPGTGFWGYADPASGAVWGPEIMAANGIPPALFGLPGKFTTNADLMKLPVYTFSMGIGDPSQPPPFQADKAKWNNTYHFYAQDTWKFRPNLTLNYGLGWSWQSTLVNHDLDKPQILASVLGPTGLSATDNSNKNFSPSVGFAWTVDKSQKTVIRSGAGIYYDTRLLWQRLEERSYLGPAGNGRVLISSASVPSPISLAAPTAGFPAVTAGTTPLDFRSAPSAFTLGNLLQILPGIRAQLEAQVKAQTRSDLAIRNVDVAKQATNLIPAHYPASYSEHFNFGVQRELRRDMVLNADFVFRQSIHQEIGSLDYNRYFRATGPVAPKCTPLQASNPLYNACLTGPVTVRTPAGRTNYKALLVKLDKRFSHRYQLQASYALQERYGINGIQNLDSWFQSWGPQGGRHNLNISGVVDLPWKFQASFISQMSTRGPVFPQVTGVDLTGSGVDAGLLPVADYMHPTRNMSQSDLAAAVDAWNATYPDVAGARPKTSRGQTIPKLALPSNYELGDAFSSQDIRVTKHFEFFESHKVKISLIGEVFNVFNIANLGGRSFTLNNTASFGQATSRAGQVFGSGGPRAVQIAARVSF